jgi:hypothetical protein
MQLSRLLEKASHRANTGDRRLALQQLLRSHSERVFGGAKTIEREVEAFNALNASHLIALAADDFDVVESLRIIKSDHRPLPYQNALREGMSLEQVDRHRQKSDENDQHAPRGRS